jgi:hypothetical protein
LENLEERIQNLYNCLIVSAFHMQESFVIWVHQYFEYG